MSENELEGVFSEIDSENTAHNAVDQTETAEAEETASTAETETNTKTQNQNTEEVETQETGTTDEGTTSTDATSTETNEHSQTETQTEAVDQDWKQTLPPAPAPYQGPVPEVDENGQITNMSPVEYATYMRESTKAELRAEAYQGFVENRALDAAEKILPEMKSNPTVRMLVQNARVASVINGQQIDAVEAAKQVREALGLAPTAIANAKAEGANNAKASITVQKNAALETGTSNKGSDEADKITNLQKRIKRGDDEAFAELLGEWEKSGKLK